MIMRKTVLFFLASITAFVVFSCSEDSTKPENMPMITEVSPASAYIGQEIIIFGDSFGFGDIEAMVVFDSTIFVDKIDCIKWNNAQIKVVVPSGANSGEVFVITNGDTSNVFQMNIDRLPDFNMILVPSGTFQMGSESGNQDEMPVHTVNIDSLYVAEHEVTQLLWRSVMGNLNEDYLGDEYPVANFGWYSAVEFCNKLSLIEGLDTCYYHGADDIECDFDANGYRMPTEAEWEYLCRAGTSGDYYDSYLPDIAWFAGNSGFQRHPVGRKMPNSFGLYDMHGNLWEFCWDWYGEDYYSKSPVDNPKGPDNGNKDVLRGGSYADGEFFLRSANRSFPHSDSSLCGLRIVKSK